MKNTAIAWTARRGGSMREVGMSFTAESVRAILAGRKTQTRRVLKRQSPIDAECWAHNSYVGPEGPSWFWWKGLPADGPLLFDGSVKYWPEGGLSLRCWLGDRIYVKETWKPNEPPSGFIYRADPFMPEGGWHSAMFMPKVAARIWLSITAVRVERLQDISEEDAEAEGCKSVSWEQWYEGKKPILDGSWARQQSRGLPPATWRDVEKLNDYDPCAKTARELYRLLWDSINGKRHPWASNPWVVVYQWEAWRKESNQKGESKHE